MQTSWLTGFSSFSPFNVQFQCLLATIVSFFFFLPLFLIRQPLITSLLICIYDMLFFSGCFQDFFFTCGFQQFVYEGVSLLPPAISILLIPSSEFFILIVIFYGFQLLSFLAWLFGVGYYMI